MGNDTIWAGGLGGGGSGTSGTTFGQGEGSGGVVMEENLGLEASPLLPDVTPPFPVMARCRKWRSEMFAKHTQFANRSPFMGLPESFHFYYCTTNNFCTQSKLALNPLHG